MEKINHSKAAAQFVQDEARTNWHNGALWHVRANRDKAVQQIPEWEELRQLAAQIKSHTLSHLDSYLAQFEQNALANGVQVHWAKDAAEHNQIVHEILQKHQVKSLVKSKSMLTEECQLNPYLEQQGIEVIDTDLGERIVQLAKEAPSHIVIPAIHKKKEEISTLFHQTLGTELGNVDPTYLTRAARKDLRQKFLQADAALTGVNFALADTGGVVVCTNEGNADMGVHLAPVQIHCMGIEKLIPKAEHLAVFTRILARSATGQAITVYTSHFHRPRPKTEMHIVLVDNGRAAQLGRPKFYKSLTCIRCGACMNTCPIYRRSGGHSYGTTVPGPIGSVLAPGKDPKKFANLPFASTLCGSCTDVCPVKINLHEQLLQWRQSLSEELPQPQTKRIQIRALQYLLTHPRSYRRIGSLYRLMRTILPSSLARWLFGAWAKQRDLPPAPEQSFRAWYKKNRSV